MTTGLASRPALPGATPPLLRDSAPLTPLRFSIFVTFIFHLEQSFLIGCPSWRQPQLLAVGLAFGNPIPTRKAARLLFVHDCFFVMHLSILIPQLTSISRGPSTIDNLWTRVIAVQLCHTYYRYVI